MVNEATQLRVLRAIAKEMFRKERRSLDPTEIHRKRGDWEKEAKILGVTVEELAEVTLPIIEEVFDDGKKAYRDLAQPKSKSSKR